MEWPLLHLESVGLTGWAGPLLALAAFAESLVLIGAVVPATPLLVVVGGFIAAGKAPPTLVAWAAAGAFFGSWTSYEIGAIARRRGLRLKGMLGERVQRVTGDLFARYGPAAIIIGRFLGPAAAVAPFAAGWSAMPRRLFLAANLATCILWPVAMAALGYLGIGLSLSVM